MGFLMARKMFPIVGATQFQIRRRMGWMHTDRMDGCGVGMDDQTYFDGRLDALDGHHSTKKWLGILTPIE